MIHTCRTIPLKTNVGKPRYAPFFLKLMLVNPGMQIHLIFAYVLPMQDNICG